MNDTSLRALNEADTFPFAGLAHNGDPGKRTALAVLAFLTDRCGVGDELSRIADDDKSLAAEIVDGLAAIVRPAHDKTADCSAWLDRFNKANSR